MVEKMIVAIPVLGGLFLPVLLLIGGINECTRSPICGKVVEIGGCQQYACGVVLEGGQRGAARYPTIGGVACLE